MEMCRVPECVKQQAYENRIVHLRQANSSGDFGHGRYSGGLDLLVFRGKGQCGLLESEGFFQDRSAWCLPNISRGK